MKKGIILVFIILICFKGFSQYPIQQNLGAATTLVKNPNYGGFQGGLIPYTFADTTAASASLTYGRNYDGFLIYTTNFNALWFRSNTLNKWVQILPSGGGLGNGGWLLNYNTLLPQAYGNIGFGLVQNRGINFATNNTVRFSLDSTGILPYSETVKGMGIDSVSGKLSYWKDEYKTQTENYLTYNIPFAPTSFTDSTLVSQLDGATTSYYFNKGLWLNGTYTGSIQNSRLVGWNYGFLTNQNFSQKLVFKVGDSSTSLSIGIGVKAGQALATTVNQANYITATLGDSTVSTLTNIALSQSTTKSSGILINKGDIIELQVNQIADSVQFFYRNLTNNNSYNIVRKIDFETNTQYLSVLGYPTIYFAKGNVKLISYSVYNQDFDYVFLGNSITAGYRTPTVSGFVNQLRPYTDGTINNMSRSASVSTDWVYQVKNNFNFTNKTVFMSGVCGNDLLGGLSAATSKANYQAIVSALRAKGNRIVHIDNPFRVIFLGSGTWADLVALNNWLDTTYRGIDTIIHTQVQTEANYPAWYTDGAHFNATGNTAITNIILNKVQNLFPLQNPITSTTVDSNYYKPTVKDTSGREFKVSWNNFSSGGTVTSVTGTANQISVATGTTTPVISLVSGGTLPGAWALGTPASGTVTNLTGTASININGTVGATTPTTGAFTTGTFTGLLSIARTATATSNNQVMTESITGTLTARSTASDNLFSMRNTQVFTATANNQNMVGLSLAPTYSTGAFTGTSGYPLEVYGAQGQGMLRVKTIASTTGVHIGDWTGTGYGATLVFIRPSGAYEGTIMSQGNADFTINNGFGSIVFNQAGAVSQPAVRFTGNPYTAGTTTTDHPLVYLNGGTAPTTWSDNGTYLGVNAVSGFTGNLFDAHLNGSASVFNVDYIGNIYSRQLYYSNNHINLSNGNSISIGTDAAGSVTFFTNGSDKWTINSSGHLLPATNATYDIGSASFRVSGIYANGITAYGTATLAATGVYGLFTQNYIAGASESPLKIVSNPYTAGTATTNHPLVYRNGGTAPTTWSTAGTYDGWNAVSGFTGNFLDFHVNGGASVASLTYNGIGKFATAVYAQEVQVQGGTVYFNDGSGQYSRIYGAGLGADGIMKLTNTNNNGFTMLGFGPLTSSFPALRVNSTGLDVKLGDNSAYTTIRASQHIVATSVFWSSGTGSPEGVLTANIGSLYSRTDGGAGTSLYVKESGTGNTGWVAK